MVRVDKNVYKFIIVALLVLTYIQLCDSRRRYASRSSGGFGKWISSIFYGPPEEYKEEKPWENFPGGVIPPKGAPLSFKERNDYYAAQLLPRNQSSEGHRLSPPPPPPPGFLNTPDTSGAPPIYTYNINYFYSRRPNDTNLLSSFAMWEIIKHRSNYNLYSTVNRTSYIAIEKVPDNSTVEPGKLYMVVPNDVTCDITSHGNINYYMAICKTNKDINITVILPNNKTSIIKCGIYIYTECIGWNIFDNEEFTPVKYEVFNETEVYGAPLCNTTVVGGVLAVDNFTESSNSIACIYPPYKWTGRNWISIYENEKNEKIKHNLQNLPNLENNTLKALSHATYFGKMYDFLTINKNKL